MLLHAFWRDVYIVFKKRETCAFLSHLIYNFTVYIVNNTASPYVEYSIKHFYFFPSCWNLEEKKKKKCFPLAMLCVLDHGGELDSKCWRQRAKRRTECIIHCERLMELTTWMLERVHLLSSSSVKVFWFCTFFFLLFLIFFFYFVFASLFTWLKGEGKKKKGWKKIFLIL